MKSVTCCIKPLSQVYTIYGEDNFNMDNTYMVDDNPVSYAENTSNALPIIKYTYVNEFSDKELLYMIDQIKFRQFINCLRTKNNTSIYDTKNREYEYYPFPTMFDDDIDDEQDDI